MLITSKLKLVPITHIGSFDHLLLLLLLFLLLFSFSVVSVSALANWHLQFHTDREHNTSAVC